MPKRKYASSSKSSKTSKRRKLFKRRRTARKRPTLSINPSFLPRHKLVRMRYVQSNVLDATTGGVIVQNFSTNSVYDPDTTGTGHQPYLFDQLSDLYGKYTVVASKIITKAISQHAGASIPAAFGLIITDSPTALSGKTIDEILEFAPRPNYKIVGGTTHAVATLTSKWSARRGFSIGKGGHLKYESNTGTTGNFGTGTNPPKQHYFSLYLNHIASTDPWGFEFKTVIEYIVLFHERKIKGAS